MFIVLKILLPFSEVIKVCARNVSIRLRLWCFALLPVSTLAAAQCVPDAFLAMGSQHAASSEAGTVTQLSETQILALPVAVITTGTDWTAVSRFEGPLLSDVLKSKPGQTGNLQVLALNQYGATVPASDLDRFGPILAHTRDGVRLKRSDFGPLFIVYPRDRYRELRAPNMAARMVWQVCRIDVE
ncbi:oxidoreductase [Polaromonas sp.]|uniref:oxidoreductase n=1 Tax=Polaromonas sp. TaxID=1869339 RepID=UPI00352BAC59